MDLRATPGIAAAQQAWRRLAGAPFLAALVCAAVLRAQAPVPDVSAIGPQVGDRVPEFSGSDQFGKHRTLGSLLGPNGAMIVFFRSADW